MEIVLVLALFVAVGFAIIYIRWRVDEQERRHIAAVAEQDRQLLASVTSPNRGTQAERDLVLMLLKHGISPKAIFHDLYLRKPRGDFSQIDLVVATKVGIVVFEVKDYSGRIFGNGHRSNWIQILAYGRQKYKFYNPIMQNSGHIAHLRKRLGEDVPFYSVIMFDGNCELKDITFVPDGTFIVKPWRVLEVVDGIINKSEPANYLDKRKVVAVLKEAVENGNNADVQSQHVEDVKDRLGKERIYD